MTLEEALVSYNSGAIPNQDLKGNLLGGSRRLAADYHAVPDWLPLAGLTDIDAIATTAEALL
ncbi:MAG: hypothetical protein ABI134_33075, partial [Byssovorax sp.]